MTYYPSKFLALALSFICVSCVQAVAFVAAAAASIVDVCLLLASFAP